MGFVLSHANQLFHVCSFGFGPSKLFYILGEVLKRFIFPHRNILG